MSVAVLIMIVSTVILLFCLQAICQKRLQRQFTTEFYKTIVSNNRLEFPLIRKGVEEFGSPGEYLRLSMALKCDFLAVKYLLENASNIDQRYNPIDELLILYFRVQSVSLFMRHWLRLPENSTVLKLTNTLQYFANVVGERINTTRGGNLTAFNYLAETELLASSKGTRPLAKTRSLRSASPRAV
jgi:hypothetical protein